MKFLKSLPMLVLALILMVLIVNNRQLVSINLFPLPYDVMLPVYLLLFAGIFTGLGIGAYVLAGRRLRAAAEKHKLRREMARLQSQIGDLQTQLREQADTDEPSQISGPGSGANSGTDSGKISGRV